MEDWTNDPRLLFDTQSAAELLRSAVRAKTKIRVIGDYDVDGICSSYILVKGLRAVGADVTYALPNRITDGYGLNGRMIDEAIADGIGLIITCDNGIFTGVDTGLVKYHFELGAGKENFEWK